MSSGGSTKIIRSDVQINLRAGDEAMTEQIANCYQANAGANKMRGEGMPDAMR